MNPKRRVFSGTRPTGRLHLGNYLGAIKGYIELQNQGDLDCIYCVVDLHGITTPYNKETYREGVREVVLDYLGAGLDPEKCHIIIQSDLRAQHLELAYYFATIFPVSRTEDLPTYKDKKSQHPDYINMGLLYYPILMAADIALYKADLVPVGLDQEPHLEYTREVVRRFNSMFGEVFPEPIRFDTPGRYVPSLLGKGKMSKSVDGSYISLGDDLQTIRAKLAKAPTDSGKGPVDKFQDGPLSPEKIDRFNDAHTITQKSVAGLLELVELFEGEEKRKKYDYLHETAGIRYSDLKDELADAIYATLQPIQEKRAEFAANPRRVDQILAQGETYASSIADETLKEVRGRMGLE